jgi:hypothetical protein
MKYKDFIQAIDLCPICGNRMLSERLSTTTNYYPDKFILVFNCLNDNHFHYESYECIQESLVDDLKILVISFQINNFSASWFDDKKELCIRDPLGKVILKKVFKNKSFEDWVSCPYKNIVDKVNSFMLLI